MTASALTITQPLTQLPAPTSLTEIQSYAKLFAESRMFADCQQMAQAAVKMIAGAELGIRPFASMNGIHIIKGKTTIAAGLMATLIKRSDRYNYRVTEHSETICKIAFFEHSEPCGETSFSIEDAKKANLLANTTWQNYPRNMLFARALSNGARWYCADVFGGPVYTPEEMGANVNADGEVIDIPSYPVHAANHALQIASHAQEPTPAPQPQAPTADPTKELKRLSVAWTQRIEALPDTDGVTPLEILTMMYPEASGFEAEDYKEALNLMDDAIYAYCRAIRRRKPKSTPAPLTVTEADPVSDEQENVLDVPASDTHRLDAFK